MGMVLTAIHHILRKPETHGLDSSVWKTGVVCTVQTFERPHAGNVSFVPSSHYRITVSVNQRISASAHSNRAEAAQKGHIPTEKNRGKRRIGSAVLLQENNERTKHSVGTLLMHTFLTQI